MGKTWSDLLKIMCCIVLPLPPIKPNGTSCLSYLPKHIPTQPNLNTVPHICTNMTLGCAIGLRLRPQTAPRHDLKATKRPHLRQTQSTFHRTTTS